MDKEPLPSNAHPMGEHPNCESDLSKIHIQCDTYAGLVHVEWDNHAPVTPIGLLIFFTQFLKTCNLFSSWVKDVLLNIKVLTQVQCSAQ